MFDVSAIHTLAAAHQPTLSALDRIRVALNEEFDGLEDAVLALILAVASGEPLLLIGPPGTAKSRIIRRFCALVGIDTGEEGAGYFEYLLTPFTEPGELWGFYDPRAIRKGALERIHAELMMQRARVVFLDEMFKGSSAILNSLLAFMNERIFYDRGRRVAVPLECFFAATNELPAGAELAAVADRFALRCRVDNAQADGGRIGELLAKAWPMTYGPNPPVGAVSPTLLGDLKRLRTDVARSNVFRPDAQLLRLLAGVVSLAREFGLSQMSNRRVVKSLYVMLMHRIYDEACRPDDKGAPLRGRELRLLPLYFLDDTPDESTVRQIDSLIREQV